MGVQTMIRPRTLGCPGQARVLCYWGRPWPEPHLSVQVSLRARLWLRAKALWSRGQDGSSLTGALKTT